MQHIIMIAGSNGSGKSTIAPALLKDAIDVVDFVNADTIAEGLCAFEPQKAAFLAGRIMLDRIHYLAKKNANFAFETTLASRTFSTWIPELKKQGYQFHLVFLWLKQVDLALARVSQRVRIGGHYVPDLTIQRRYQAGLRNFFDLYQPLADSWYLYDNSQVNQLNLIANKIKNSPLFVKDNRSWQYLVETYHHAQPK